MRQGLIKVEVEYQFRGYFLVKAETREQAYQEVERNCSMLSQGIQCTSSKVYDYEFSIHPTGVTSYKRWELNEDEEDYDPYEED